MEATTQHPYYCGKCGGWVTEDASVCPNCRTPLSGKGQGDEDLRRQLRRAYRRQQIQRLRSALQRLAPQAGIALAILAGLALFAFAIYRFSLIRSIVAITLLGLLLALVALATWAKAAPRFQNIRGPWGSVYVTRFRDNIAARSLLRAVHRGDAERTHKLLGRLCRHEKLATSVDLARTCVAHAVKMKRAEVLSELAAHYRAIFEVRYTAYRETIAEIVRGTGDSTLIDVIAISKNQMSHSLPPTWKNCVTCERWGGPRKLSKWCDQVDFQDYDDKGECVGGVWDRQDVRALDSCKQWVKWAQLK